MEKQQRWISAGLILLVIVLLVLSITQSAQAAGIIYGDNVPKGVVVTNDVILFGDTVTIDGTVDGDVLAVGGAVNINGEVAGSLVTAAQTIVQNGAVSGSVYAASMQMLLGGSADIGRSLYYIGLSLIAQSGATIQRDLYGITLGATLGAAEIEGDIRAVIGPVEILRLVLQAFGYQVDWPLLAPPEASAAPRRFTDLSPAAGSLSLGMLRSAMLLASPGDLPVLERRTGSLAAQGTPADQTTLWLTTRLRELITYLVFALLAIWLFRSQLDGSAAAGRARPWAALGYGLLGMLLVFNTYLLALVLAAAVFAIGLFLGTATLWGLALAFWAVGLSVIAIATTLLMLFMVYGTKIIAAYWFGRLVLNPIAPGALRYRLVPLLLGLIVFLLLQSISIVGWVFAVLATAFGLGSAWLYYSGQRKSKDLHQEEEPAPLLEPVSAAEPAQESGEAVTEAAEPATESAPALDVQETSAADSEVK
jgi:cytoskeletal protein CcmA (bactofilin family)